MIQQSRDSASREAVPASPARSLPPQHLAQKAMAVDEAEVGVAAAVVAKAKKVKEKERTKDRSEDAVLHREAVVKAEKGESRIRGIYAQISK